MDALLVSAGFAICPFRVLGALTATRRKSLDPHLVWMGALRMNVGAGFSRSKYNVANVLAKP